MRVSNVGNYDMADVTPRPWRVIDASFKKGEYCKCIEGDEWCTISKSIAALHGLDKAGDVLMPNKTQKANAEHIVRCVNAHESLVDALEEIADLPGYDAKIGLTLQAVVSAYERARTIARAAIAACE